MKRIAQTIIATVLIVLSTDCAAQGPGQTGGDAATQPAPASGPTSRPATDTAPAEPQVDAVLKALEQAGEKFGTIKGDIQYQVVNRMLGDKEVRTGWVAYQKAAKDTPAGLRVHFATLRLDEGAQFDEKIDYAFDGKRLSIARHKLKQISRYRIPHDQRNQPIKLGEGPLPLPFGQKAEEMLKHFTITTRAPDSDDPKNTDYLKLVPQAERADRLNVSHIEMWVARDTGLPAKIVSVALDGNETTVELSKLQTDMKLEESVFSLSKPTGWRESIQDLESGKKLTP
ncbi:MAG TPA: outer membrane lipoprotein carrier protein LolA [Phycisphaerae bacterium]|nr:outer membrane lipoprotein carrier protein LolA [Phycisphaerae bacterium]